MIQEAPQDVRPKHSRRRRRLLLAVALLACSIVGFPSYLFLTHRPLDVGPETTILEGPLLPDGRVDYVAAINAQITDGATPENNAVVPLLRALGPETIREDDRQEYFRLLGVPQPPLDGNYLIDTSSWILRRSLNWDWHNEFSEATIRPWSTEEFPEVAAWLEANAEHFELIVEASHRPRFYSPLVSTGSETPLIEALLNGQLPQTRRCADLLTARAMLRLQHGDLEGAWDDLLACHRISRLVGDRGAASTIVSNLTASAIFQRAFWASESFVVDERLSAELARKCVADLVTLTPLPGFSGAMDVAERYQDLDLIQSMARGYVPRYPSELRSVCELDPDWNLVMQFANEHYDEFVDAFQLATYQERINRHESLHAVLRATAVEFASRETTEGTVRELSREAADIIVALKAGGLFVFLNDPDDSPFRKCCIAQCLAEARMRLLQIALVLRAFEGDNGAHPADLEQLSPDYLAEIPLDPFTDEPFRYEQTETGYRLYSVGDNMTDDGGLTYDSDPQGDDIIVETPVAADATDQSGESP